MNILILANFDVGLYRFRQELIRELLKEHSVAIALPDGELVRPLEEMGCRFYEIPVDRRGVNPVKDAALFMGYRKLIRQIKPDLVITYTVKPNIYGGLACRLLGVPYAANITGLGTAFQKEGMLRRLVSGLYKLALKRAKVVFFENRGNLQTLLDGRIVEQRQCCLLSGAGVDLEHFSPAPYPGDEPVRFLFIGRVMAEKGVNELFEAMGRLRGEGYDCTLDVLGHLEEDYAEKIRAAEGEGWLRYHGQQRCVKPFIAQAHCFVLPSWHEGMANTNLECAAMARPLITSSIHGCREAVVEEVSGLLCEAKNAESLYRAMKRFLQMPNTQRAAMGAAGRKHMETVFDKKKVVADTLAALEIK